MSQVTRKRVELSDLISRSDLTSGVKAFAEALGLSGGVVRMPAPGETTPQDPEEFKQFRLTDVVCSSEFCCAVRRSRQGNLKCMWSDLKHAAVAASSGAAQVYRCHMRLIDVVAAVKVAGHHVANVYLGQCRPRELRFREVWSRYRELDPAADDGKAARSARARLKSAFDALPQTDEGAMKKVGAVVQAMADLLSQRCTRQLILKRLSEIGESPGIRWSVRGGMQAFLQCAESVLDCDTASVFLVTDDGRNLRSEVLHWGEIDERDPISFRVGGDGLIPTIFREDKFQFRPTAASIAEIVPSDPRYRELRRLHSFVGCPIRYQGKPIGVMEVGSSKENAFSWDDGFLLKAIANHAGVFLGGLKDRSQLLRIFAHGFGSAKGISQALIERIPPLIDGDGCSLFLRTKDGPDAILFASDEFPESCRGKLGYKPGQGLTGWVLEHGIAMLIDGGDSCRKHNFPKHRYPGATWCGVHQAADRKPLEYYEDRPFLAVPVFDRRRRVLGVLRVADRNAGDFTEKDEKLLQDIADYIGFMHEWTQESDLRYMESARRVFISHGHNVKVRRKITDFLETQLGLTPVVLKEQPPIGKTVIEAIEHHAQRCSFAVIICTGDDRTYSRKRRPRQNVVHELGYLHGLYGRDRVVVFCQKGIELFSNIGGLIRIEFAGNDVASGFPLLRKALEDSHIIAPQSRDSAG